MNESKSRIEVTVDPELREMFAETFGVSINPASGNLNIQLYTEFVGNPTHFEATEEGVQSVPLPSQNLTRRMVGKIIVTPKRALELSQVLNNLAGELKMLTDRQDLSNN